jgi:alkylation response protein AidB-like acyl-CoA dehydrogenase
VHLVLAKIPNPDGSMPTGTAGLSLFIVPKILPDGSYNDVAVAGLNHKMGYRGTANCLLNFGEADGAIGWIVGEPEQGLRQMFLMMNEARISVGLGAAALGYRSHRLSVDYARERLQGRPIGQRGGAPVPIIEHPDVKRMLLQQKSYVEGALALCLYCARLVDEEADPQAVALLGLLTPVAKTWPSEYGLAANDIAIQIHGGYGYTRRRTIVARQPPQPDS